MLQNGSKPKVLHSKYGYFVEQLQLLTQMVQNGSKPKVLHSWRFHLHRTKPLHKIHILQFDLGGSQRDSVFSHSSTLFGVLCLKI